jgi:hypothetical protein
VRPFAAVLAILVVWSFPGRADGKVAAAEQAMAVAYAALVEKLDAAAKLHLEEDQARWLADRRACKAEAPRQDDCLEFRYRTRTEKLKAFGKGPYPFISEQAIVQSGKGTRGDYFVDISYARFDGRSPDFTEVNRRFAAGAQALALIAANVGFRCSITQTFSLYRLSATVVSVTEWHELVTARVEIRLEGQLVDLVTGRTLAPEEVFAPGEEWRRRLAHLVDMEIANDSEGQGGQRKPRDIVGIMGEVESTDYLFQDDKLVLSLKRVARERGMKAYTVEIPYAALKPFLRADGPLGGVRR